MKPDLVLVSGQDSAGKPYQKYQFVRGSNPNVNDPAQFSEPLDCGCHIFSSVSRAMCFAACGIF